MFTIVSFVTSKYRIKLAGYISTEPSQKDITMINKKNTITRVQEENQHQYIECIFQDHRVLFKNLILYIYQQELGLFR